MLYHYGPSNKFRMSGSDLSGTCDMRWRYLEVLESMAFETVDRINPLTCVYFTYLPLIISFEVIIRIQSSGLDKGSTTAHPNLCPSKTRSKQT